jgi:alkanesulfonate monooxygenase SsuD/methylene tetrahydromethanopterin reductase-like flavin-dependent oxidoreductase (luciferase family)
MTPIGSVRPRVVLGGDGKPRSLRLAVHYADEYNVVSARPETARRVSGDLDAACAGAGRDPREITRSAMVGVLVGRNAGELERRHGALREALGEPDSGDAWIEERRTRWVFGTPDEARAAVQRFADAGIERMMLQDFLPRDLDMIDVMGEELVGRV